MEGSWDPIDTPRLQQMCEDLEVPTAFCYKVPSISRGPDSQHQIRMSLSRNQGTLKFTSRMLALKQSQLACMCRLIFPFPSSHMVAWFIPKPSEAPWLSASWEPSSQLAASGQFRWPEGAGNLLLGSWDQAISGNSETDHIIEKRYIIYRINRIKINSKKTYQKSGIHTTFLVVDSSVGIPWLCGCGVQAFARIPSSSSSVFTGKSWKTWHSTSSRAPWTNPKSPWNDHRKVIQTPGIVKILTSLLYWELTIQLPRLFDSILGVHAVGVAPMHSLVPWDARLLDLNLALWITASKT